MINVMIELELWNTNADKQVKVFDKTIEDKKHRYCNDYLLKISSYCLDIISIEYKLLAFLAKSALSLL